MADPTQPEYLVCALASQRAFFADDEFGACCKCDARVRFRPYASRTAKRICISCSAPMIAEAAARGGPIKPVVSPEAAREAALFFAKTGGRS